MNKVMNIILIVVAVLFLSKTLLPYLVDSFFNFPAVFAEFLVMIGTALLTVFLIYPMMKKK